MQKWGWVKEDRRGNERLTENKGGDLQTVNKVRNCALYFTYVLSLFPQQSCDSKIILVL